MGFIERVELAVRVRAQTETAAAIADAFSAASKISQLIYPGRADHPQAALVKKQMRAGSTLVGFEALRAVRLRHSVFSTH